MERRRVIAGVCLLASLPLVLSIGARAHRTVDPFSDAPAPVGASASRDASPVPTANGPCRGAALNTTRVTVKLVPDAALALRQGRPPSISLRELLDDVEAHGLTLEPMHPATDDRNLSTYFIIEVADLDTATRLLEQIRKSKSTEAAYIKPADELPQF